MRLPTLIVELRGGLEITGAQGGDRTHDLFLPKSPPSRIMLPTSGHIPEGVHLSALARNFMAT